jgi:hypothetical protein
MEAGELFRLAGWTTDEADEGCGWATWKRPAIEGAKDCVLRAQRESSFFSRRLVWLGGISGSNERMSGGGVLEGLLPKRVGAALRLSVSKRQSRDSKWKAAGHERPRKATKGHHDALLPSVRMQSASKAHCSGRELQYTATTVQLAECEGLFPQSDCLIWSIYVGAQTYDQSFLSTEHNLSSTTQRSPSCAQTELQAPPPGYNARSPALLLPHLHQTLSSTQQSHQTSFR